MSEVFITIESDDLEGLVAQGSYLFDAAKRVGLKFEGGCDPEFGHICQMKVSSGSELLSEETQLEAELLTPEARKNGERLACQTIIEKPGEITIMAVKKEEKAGAESKAENKAEGTAEDFKKEFEDLPLEKKFASLVELEAIALGETFSYVLNSPYKAVGKVMDVMAGFGLDMEKKDRDAKRPDEHQDEPEEEKEEKKTKAAGRKKTASKPAAKRRRTKKSAPKKDSDKDETKSEDG